MNLHNRRKKLAKLREMKSVLGQEIQDIQHQLSSYSTAQDPERDHRWYQRAVHAKGEKVKELTRIKRQILELSVKDDDGEMVRRDRSRFLRTAVASAMARVRWEDAMEEALAAWELIEDECYWVEA